MKIEPARPTVSVAGLQLSSLSVNHKNIFKLQIIRGWIVQSYFKFLRL